MQLCFDATRFGYGLREAVEICARKSMPAADRLRFYAAAFDTVEVNASYYAIPAARNALLWAARTPPGFVFNVKAYSLLTGHHPRAESLPAELRVLLPAHPKLTRRGEIDRSAFGREALRECFRLYREALAPLAESGKLGYVLFQLAPWIRFSDQGLAYLASIYGPLEAISGDLGSGTLGPGLRRGDDSRGTTDGCRASRQLRQRAVLRTHRRPAADRLVRRYH